MRRAVIVAGDDAISPIIAVIFFGMLSAVPGIAG
jgi:hypothetical protein